MGIRRRQDYDLQPLHSKIEQLIAYHPPAALEQTHNELIASLSAINGPVELGVFTAFVEYSLLLWTCGVRGSPIQEEVFQKSRTEMKRFSGKIPLPKFVVCLELALKAHGIWSEDTAKLFPH